MNTARAVTTGVVSALGAMMGGFFGMQIAESRAPNNRDAPLNGAFAGAGIGALVLGAIAGAGTLPNEEKQVGTSGRSMALGSVRGFP